jgi:hypothetical protein
MIKRQINNGTQHTAIFLQGIFFLFVYICIVFGDPINKKEVRIPLTGCHWISN